VYQREELWVNKISRILPGINLVPIPTLPLLGNKGKVGFGNEIARVVAIETEESAILVHTVRIN